MPAALQISQDTADKFWDALTGDQKKSLAMVLTGSQMFKALRRDYSGLVASLTPTQLSSMAKLLTADQRVMIGVNEYGEQVDATRLA